MFRDPYRSKKGDPDMNCVPYYVIKYADCNGSGFESIGATEKIWGSKMAWLKFWPKWSKTSDVSNKSTRRNTVRVWFFLWKGVVTYVPVTVLEKFELNWSKDVDLRFSNGFWILQVLGNFSKSFLQVDNLIKCCPRNLLTGSYRFRIERWTS